MDETGEEEDRDELGCPLRFEIVRLKMAVVKGSCCQFEGDS